MLHNPYPALGQLAVDVMLRRVLEERPDGMLLDLLARFEPGSPGWHLALSYQPRALALADDMDAPSALTRNRTAGRPAGRTTMTATVEHHDHFPNVQAALDSLADDLERRVALVRLAMHINNGSEHFDHGDPGYSWLCLRCAAEGKGGLNGWAGALWVLGQVSSSGDLVHVGWRSLKTRNLFRPGLNSEKDWAADGFEPVYVVRNGAGASPVREDPE